MKQSMAVIRKTTTRVDHYYTTSKGTVMENTETGDISITFGIDGYIGMNCLVKAKEFIGWNENAPSKFENISWL